jgi:adenylate cyclase
MPNNPQLKINLKVIFSIMIAWTLVGVFIVFYNNTLLNTPYLSIGPSKIYKLNVQLLIWSFISALGGLIAGSFLVYINSKIFRKKSFRYALITTLYSYVILFIVLMFVYLTIRAFIAIENEATIKSVLDLALKMAQKFYPFVQFILWGAVTLLTLFVLQMNDKFGPGILKKFLLGQYYHPKKEDRIFMFLDMKSSTTIAEEIGNEKYFNLLSNLFSDLTDTILNNEGEIYQYVGDEIVITWPTKSGIKNANCIHCYFDIKNRLIELSSYYQSKYQTVPNFKAGLHYGIVMAGEVGVIKKDIIYSGDVLNTTARIQAKCNEFKTDLLISQNILEILEPKDLTSFKTEKIGSIVLRGKKEEIVIKSISYLS